ncbi:hypothetical protein LTR70_010212 [Exophiala xenobiotica]|uniref:Major facilitator superfamily (MFS) profile domain-containing protein n=1 Tax=Lithohypha guttulata TaxID=1690604 RepID=A0ABR0JUH8_9EURO|nr:hypothetical protein LTR24_010249 [Lithohypha guttulata]KAK5309535.1 hypothetical protein LTR70_010212 [Exophiala xenobiotica]
MIQETSKVNGANPEKATTTDRSIEDIEYDNPFRWPTRRKWFITVLMALCTLTTTFCSSIWSSTVVITSQEFDTSETVMLLGVSLFVVGFAFGPLFWGPVSELIGRKIPLFGGFFIFALLQIPIALGHSLAGLLICRLLAGCFGAAPIALVSAAYADFWDPANRGTATALYSVAAYAGPTLVVGIPAVVFVPETYGPVLKERAAKKQELRLGEQPSLFDGFMKKYLSRPMLMLLHEPMLDIMTMYIAVVYAIMYLTFFAYPYAFSERGWSRDVGSLSFLSMLVGILTSCAAVAFYSTKYYQPRLKARGKILPEDRLPPIMLGSVVLPVGLFWFGWTSSPSISWVPQIISGFFIGSGVMLIFTNGITYLVDIYLQSAASAMAANTFVRSAAAAGLPLAAPTMYRRLGTAWATSLLGFLCVALIPAPFLFYKYGESLRKKSRFAPNR